MDEKPPEFGEQAAGTPSAQQKSMDERLTYLELRVAEHSAEFRDLREAIRHLDQKVDLRFDAVDRRFDAIDRRFEAIDGRFEAIDRRFEAIDGRFEAIDRRFGTIDSRLGAIDSRLVAIDSRFEVFERNFEAVDRTFEALEEKIDHFREEFRQQLASHLRWVVGLQITTMLVMVGALLGVVLAR